MSKSPDAFRTISEAAEELDLPQHVLRHWEDVFGNIRPMRRAGGRRYYRSYDINLLNGVRRLLYDERYTTKGVQKIFKENGPQFVADLGRRSFAGELELSEISSETATSTPTVQASQSEYPLVDHDLLAQMKVLLARLESAQDHLDEAILAIDTIAAMDEE